MADEAGGTVIRGDDGSIYFIRDEVMEACKVSEPEMAQFCEKLLDENSEVSGFQMGSGKAAQSLSFLGPFQPTASTNAGWRASSTVMCPGTFSSGAEYRINPSQSR
ncbi:MAG: hypothetical protein QOG20_2826 [Pseudonocardiales bacterium]|jgi:hypothetical protein|uniref:hypothetical protein n=1 Tax=Pseudonocardia sp. TaxID=60912 RepID=UPI002603FD5B|nr:hypothetical protein [Pseudonocardia sp.]MCW2719811.1 hypothetical protein [Pseudonocardia sp.]MDT7616633.1 hypothetical protein [Pseudonocardiales bacterium]MDT7707219.1 hypothetical protein [Pseudonocardiales bacterium]